MVRQESKSRWTRISGLIVGPLLASVLLGLGGKAAPTAEPALETREEAIAAATAFRTGFGLESDRAYVARSIDQPERFPDGTYGVPLSEPEVAEMERRTEIQFAVDPVITDASSRVDWGGVYMDHTRRGEAVFLTTGDPDAVRAEVGVQIPAGVPYRVERVSFSRRDLENTRDEIKSSFEALRAAGLDVHSVGIKVSSNRVLVGVKGLTEETTARLIERFGPEVSTREEPTHQLDACTSRVICPPLKGGIKIYETINTNNICTSGFIVKLEGTTTLRVLTAGHCIELSDGQIGSGWSHHGSQFGTARTETWGQLSDADAGLISLGSLADPKNLVYASSPSDIRYVSGYIVNSAQNEGDGVCRSGKTSGYYCGHITLEDETFDVDGKLIEHQWEVDFDAIKGDSGGSMIWATKAYGIHSDSTSANPPGGHGWYSPFGWVLTKLSNYGTPITLCWHTDCDF